MHRYCKYLAVIFGLMIAATIGVSAQQYVYVLTNESANRVRAYSVSGSGSLTELGGSPFSTGGTGNPSFAFYAAGRFAINVVNNYLFTANEGGGSARRSVSAFTINPGTGALTLIAGSPFFTGEAAGSNSLSLAATAQHLFVADADANNVTVFSIGAGGVLSEIAGSPFSTGAGSGPDGIMVTPDGNYLIVARFNFDDIAVYDIGGGGLTFVTSSASPLTASANFTVAGIEIMSNSTKLFAADAASGVSVHVLDIAGNGSLSEIAGSPYTTADADNSNVALLSPDELYLFVSNQASDEITTFSVAANGALTQIPGSPVAAGVDEPQQMATNFDGTLLYVNGSDGNLAVFSVANGVLTAVVGSPFSVSSEDRPGVVSYPALPSDQRLPVELSGFSLSSGPSSVQLNWRTASETENAGFEIQRSTSEQGGFRTIASYLSRPDLAGLGTSPIGKGYSFTDQELAPGTYRYRLIDVSTEGARTVHPARTIRVESNEEIVAGSSMRLHRITPNPVNAECQVSFALPEQMDVRIDLFSSDGNLVATPVANRSFGMGNHTEAFSTEELPAGTYVVMMSAGIQTRVQRLVVVH
jgi:6-phosphogluconolactonase (cycloisomerase 2 family)